MLLSKFQDIHSRGSKGLSVLIDPDKAETSGLVKRVKAAQEAHVDFFFLGGSMVDGNGLDDSIKIIRDHSDIPVVLFPGSPLQLSGKADAVLFLSLISGRNPEYLIGNHVIAAPYLKKMDIEVLPTGYMLVDGGVPTTASYISGSQPLPNNKPEIAQATAIAGEYLGLRLLYLDAGSGAAMPVSPNLIQAVRSAVDVPLIVGGGISKPEELSKAYAAGADVVVVGNAIENNAQLIAHLSEERQKA